MRPCWLVNPATAAEVFPMTEGLFDVVIFDEASQCPIEQAVPAIYRGKTVVAAGSVRHMYYFQPAGEVWFGTDTNYVGRAKVHRPK